MSFDRSLLSYDLSDYTQSWRQPASRLRISELRRSARVPVMSFPSTLASLRAEQLEAEGVDRYAGLTDSSMGSTPIARELNPKRKLRQ